MPQPIHPSQQNLEDQAYHDQAVRDWTGAQNQQVQNVEKTGHISPYIWFTSRPAAWLADLKMLPGQGTHDIQGQDSEGTLQNKAYDDAINTAYKTHDTTEYNTAHPDSPKPMPTPVYDWVAKENQGLNPFAGKYQGRP